MFFSLCLLLTLSFLMFAYHLIRQRLLKNGFRAELIFLCFFSRLHFLQVNRDLVDLAGEFIGARMP